MTYQTNQRFVVTGLNMQCKEVECVVVFDRYLTPAECKAQEGRYDCVVISEEGFPMYESTTSLDKAELIPAPTV